MSKSDLIRLSGVTKNYAGGQNSSVRALNEVDLAIRHNEMVAITGRSGSGKSTLLHIMAGLTRPTSGSVLINGRDPNAMRESEVAQFRNREMGFVFQSFFLEPSLSAGENVGLPLIARGVPKLARTEIVVTALEKVGLAHRVNHRPAELSGGEIQRVCVARAIVNEPNIVFADEPTGNLDTESGRIVMDLLCGLVSASTSVILVTHNQDDASRSDRNVCLADGEIVE